jgi:cold shock CspA family protein
MSKDHFMGFENGTILKWDDQKGYGFIKPDSENSQIFVHITAFGIIVRRPVVGDRVYFDTIIEQGGKRSAKIARIIEGEISNVVLKQRSLPSRPARQNYGFAGVKTKKRTNNLALFILAVIVIIAGTGKIFNGSYPHVSSPKNFAPTPATVQTGPEYKCEGKRRCSQMISAEEAKFYLDNCPHDGMDGDGDGIPCEKQFGN